MRFYKVFDWNKGLPYLDGVEFYHVLPFSPEMASAILAGRVDYVRATDPVTTRKAKATQGMSTAKVGGTNDDSKSAPRSR